ncbi:unnamed protein product [Psylliodes chrysocephalus]|uniref:REJ domain-containing protein n=1 Tax=Psylliodes chrysocephalus TaxID=3402493 RepID=A0A9P0CW76_9CUCU|nr:unnamed protein product [Psylliodes chrysocephala]
MGYTPSSTTIMFDTYTHRFWFQRLCGNRCSVLYFRIKNITIMLTSSEGNCRVILSPSLFYSLRKYAFTL